MKTILLLLAALAAGYLGGYLALAQAQEQEKIELRSAVEELLSELTFTVEESCEQLVGERRRVEQLIRSLRENKTMDVPVDKVLSSTQEPEQAICTNILGTRTQNPTNNVTSELWDQVVSLDKQGKSSTEIAKELDMGEGEVQLVLNLARQEKQ